MEGVKRRYEEVIKLSHQDKEWTNVSIALENLADSQTSCGELREAVESATEALFYAGVEETGTPQFAVPAKLERPSSLPIHDRKEERKSRACRAQALSLAGKLSAASRDFAGADALERKYATNNEALYSRSGIRWCGHRLRLGDIADVRRLTEANRAICERYGYHAMITHCDLLLGELDLEAGDRESATRRIGEAVRVFREARQGKDLPDALLAQARLRRSVEDCEEALRLAARSGFALKQCDAFNLRALLRREAGQPADAAEDARKALEIAERCGYYWGRHEALRQLRDAAKALGNRADERHWDEAERALAAKMQPRIQEALEIEHAHDHEMEQLYGKK